MTIARFGVLTVWHNWVLNSNHMLLLISQKEAKRDGPIAFAQNDQAPLGFPKGSLEQSPSEPPSPMSSTKAS